MDKDDSKARSDWKLNEEWAWFIGNNRERLKLTTKPELLLPILFGQSVFMFPMRLAT